MDRVKMPCQKEAKRAGSRTCQLLARRISARGDSARGDVASRLIWPPTLEPTSLVGTHTVGLAAQNDRRTRDPTGLAFQRGTLRCCAEVAMGRTIGPGVI